MKFTILSHAGLYVEHEGVSILVDPWLIGSCYWRSWWNYPEPDRALTGNLKPDYIYLTHLHWDHFHGPSLRLFDRSTKVLVPLVPSRRMVRDLCSLGFKTVQEVPHGKGLQLGAGLEMYSYQFGIGTDSAIVMTDGQTTLFNSNDCKFFGFPLKQITRRFEKIDFVFRSHSSASAIPYCVENYEESAAQVRPPQDYIEEFSRFAIHVGARYAIPFASNHCFLHKETIRYNHTSVTPNSVEGYCNELATSLDVKTRCVAMPPGSNWSDVDGFKIEAFDYEKKQEYVAHLAAKYADKLARQYEKEERRLANFKVFEKYYQRLFDAVPAIVMGRRKLRVLFKVTDREGDKYWLVDFVERVVKETVKEEPASFMIETPAIVINDCAQKKMFSVWTASKRLRIRLLTDERLTTITFFFYLLDLYETDFFPLRRNLSARSLGIGLRRWRELAELVKRLFIHKVSKKPFKVVDLYPSPAQNSFISQ